MLAVAVAGGLGDMGRLIVAELVQRKKYDVYVLSRKPPQSEDGKHEAFKVLQTHYTEESLMATLSEHHIHTVICTMAIDFQSAADAQVMLIQASDKVPSVKRFIPSEFNIDYDLDDDILPYPEKLLHVASRRALEKTSLEYAYIYNGMFMDYYGMPNIDTHLRPLYNVVDPSHGVAAIPGDGNRVVVMTYTKDVARYTSLILEMEKWPRVIRIVGSQFTLNNMVRLVEQNIGRCLSVTYDPIKKLRQNEVTILPSNEQYINYFPGGRSQVKNILASLGAAMALGAYDVDKLGKDGLDVVQYFKGQAEPPLRLEQLIVSAWKGK